MTNIITAIFAVFTAIGNWIVGAIVPLQDMFWTAGTGGEAGLTFMGTLAVVGLGFSVVFLFLSHSPQVISVLEGCGLFIDRYHPEIPPIWCVIE